MPKFFNFRKVKIKLKLQMGKQKKDIKITPELIEEVAKLVYERIRVTYVERDDFEELKGIVRQLSQNVLSLAEAQRKTQEEFVLFREMTEENFRRVWEAINQLAEAQRRTEERLNAFEKATEENFRRVWEAINQLAEAQRRTEERLNQLIAEHQRTREILAGISDTVGYGLEDKVMLYMKEFAKDEYGIEAEAVGRRNIVYPDGRYDEVNIYIEGRRDGEKVYVIGECKSRPSKSEVDKLVKKRERLRNYLNADVYAFIVGYHFTPEVELYLQEEHPDVKVFRSYEFEMRYGRR